MTYLATTNTCTTSANVEDDGRRCTNVVQMCCVCRVRSYLLFHRPGWLHKITLLLGYCSISRQTRNVKTMLVQCWASVVDGGPTLNQQCCNGFLFDGNYVWYCSSIAVLMLAQCRRRWACMKQTKRVCKWNEMNRALGHLCAHIG